MFFKILNKWASKKSHKQACSLSAHRRAQGRLQSRKAYWAVLPITLSVRTPRTLTRGGWVPHSLGAGSYSPYAPAWHSLYPEPIPAPLWSPPRSLPTDSPACWSGVHIDNHLLVPERETKQESTQLFLPSTDRFWVAITCQSAPQG